MTKWRESKWILSESNAGGEGGGIIREQMNLFSCSNLLTRQRREQRKRLEALRSVIKRQIKLRASDERQMIHRCPFIHYRRLRCDFAVRERTAALCVWSGRGVRVYMFINRCRVRWLEVRVWHRQHIFYYINPTGNDARCHLSLRSWQCAWHDLKRKTVMWRQIALATRRRSMNRLDSAG